MSTLSLSIAIEFNMEPNCLVATMGVDISPRIVLSRTKYHGSVQNFICCNRKRHIGVALDPMLLE